MYWSARSLYESENYDEAIKYFNTVIAADSLNSEYHYFRGLTIWKFYSSRRYMPEAVQSLTRAIELNPKPNYFFKRAKIKTDLGDHTGAISDLNHLISIDSKYNNVLVSFADSIISIVEHQSRYTQMNSSAIHYLNAAIQHEPNNSDLYLKRSLYGENSLSDINKAIQLDPENYRYFIRRGELYKRIGDQKNRRRECQTTSWRAEKDSECYNDYFRAINDIRKALSLNENSGEAYFFLGLLKLELPNEDGCMELSKAGQLGFDQAYREIANRCN